MSGRSKFSVGTVNEKGEGGQTSSDKGDGVFVLNISFCGEEALLMFIILLYSNAKQHFLKLKLVMYIEILRKRSNYMIICLIFFHEDFMMEPV